MTEDLMQIMRAAIDKQLPSEVGNVLKHRLEEAEIAEKRIIVLEKASSELTAKYADLQNKFELTVNELNGLKSKEQTLLNVEREVWEQKKKNDIDSLKIKMAEERANDLKEIVGLVFRNNVYKYHREKNIPIKETHYNYEGKPVTGEYIMTHKEEENIRTEG